MKHAKPSTRKNTRRTSRIELIEKQRYRSLLEHLPVGVYRTTPGGKVIEANKALAEILGFKDRTALKNTHINDLYVDKSERAGLLERLQNSGTDAAEFQLHRKDGRRIWVRDRTRGVLGTNGEITFFDGILEDVTEQKRMEEELKDNEERYRLLFEESPLGIGLARPDGKVISANEAMLIMTGYSAKELNKINLTDTYQDAEDRNRLIEAVRSSGNVTNYPARLRRKDGSTYEALLSISPIHIEGEHLLQTVCMDISERKQMEEALRRHAEELEALLATVLDITHRQDLRSLLDSIVERAARLLHAPSGGFYLCDPSRQEVRCVVSYNTPKNYVGTALRYGEGAAGLVASTSKPLIVDDYRSWTGRAEAFEDDQPFRALLSVPVTSQGEVKGVIHVLESKEARNFSESDLRLLTLFANYAAIAIENERYSEHLEELVKERTKKLAESEQQLRLMADSLPGLISYVDSEQRYRFNNKAYEDWFGQPRSAIAGKHIRDVLGEQTYQRIRGHIEAALSGEAQSYEYELPHKSGGTRYVIATYVPDFGEHGEVKGMFVLGSDITERKKTEERLLKAERLAAIGETAAMVGHDLRNPLQGITAAAYALREYSAATMDKRTREMLALIEDGVQYSNRIVNDLVEYTGEIRLDVTEATPRAIVKATLNLTKVPGNIIIANLTEDCPKVTVDSARIQRVFANIIDNAIEAMPQGGQLTLSSKQSNDKIEVRFTDTGGGMPQEIMENLWKPFQTTKAKGLGLGLALSKRIVEAHRGFIRVESTIGRGSTFTVILPVRQPSKGEDNF